MTLTPKGKLFLEYAEEMLNMLEIDERYSLVDTYFIYRSDYYFTTAFLCFKDSL